MRPPQLMPTCMHHARLVKIFSFNLILTKIILLKYFFYEKLLDEKKRIMVQCKITLGHFHPTGQYCWQNDRLAYWNVTFFPKVLFSTQICTWPLSSTDHTDTRRYAASTHFSESGSQLSHNFLVTKLINPFWVRQVE